MSLTTLTPTEREALSTLGKDDIDDLLQHFSALFPEDEAELIRGEFTSLKAHLKWCKASAFDSYSRMLRQKPAKYIHVLKLVEAMFVCSPCTAIC